MYLIFGACCKNKIYAKVSPGFKRHHISELGKKVELGHMHIYAQKQYELVLARVTQWLQRGPAYLLLGG